MARPGQARSNEEAARYLEKEREERERLEREEAEARDEPGVGATEAAEAAEDTATRQGDILGLSDVTPDVEIPQASRDRGGHPKGIDVREPTTGTAELKQSKGATGIDMGAAGSGTDLDPNEVRPTRPSEPDE